MQTFEDVRNQHEAELIRVITQDVNRFLDRQQRYQLLWADVDHHIEASYLAESLGNVELVAIHLHTVTKLLEEIYAEFPWNRNAFSMESNMR